MDITLEQTITIRIDGRDVVLKKDKAERLRDLLDDALGSAQTFTITQPQPFEVPTPDPWTPWRSPEPYYYTPYTWSQMTASGEG
jgi:hypothetical protein